MPKPRARLTRKVKANFKTMTIDNVTQLAKMAGIALKRKPRRKLTAYTVVGVFPAGHLTPCMTADLVTTRAVNPDRALEAAYALSPKLTGKLGTPLNHTFVPGTRSVMRIF
jgi:hypothetical protein